MTVMTYLDLSTGHITEGTCNRWAQSNPWPVIANYERGLLVGVPSEQTLEDSDAEIPDDLLRVIERARGLGCSFILFDTDGDLVSELPVFDW